MKINKKLLLSPLLPIVTIILLLVAGHFNSKLVTLRRKYNMVADNPVENATPLVAFTTVALGGFRGIIADILWLRASYLQDNGKYLEVAQLSDWISKLEPRCSAIWSFHAWNMAYNISIMMPDYSDRWRWVNNGIELLRDKGLKYDSGSPKIYFELGWMFEDKIAGKSDDANQLYKKQWAEEMTNLLGSGHPDYKKLENNPEKLKEMTEHYKLIPSIMQEIENKYGKLDWRCPLTHSLYWGYQAKQHAKSKKFLPGDRMIFQSLALTFLRGNQYCAIKNNGKPNTKLLYGTIAAYQTAIKLYKEKTCANAYNNFMYSAIKLLLKNDMQDTAKSVWEEWQKTASPFYPPPPPFSTFISGNKNATL